MRGGPGAGWKAGSCPALSEGGYDAVVDIREAEVSDIVELGLDKGDAERIKEASVKGVPTAKEKAALSAPRPQQPPSTAAFQRQKCRP